MITGCWRGLLPTSSNLWLSVYRLRSTIQHTILKEERTEGGGQTDWRQDFGQRESRSESAGGQRSRKTLLLLRSVNNNASKTSKERKHNKQQQQLRRHYTTLDCVAIVYHQCPTIHKSSRGANDILTLSSVCRRWFPLRLKESHHFLTALDETTTKVKHSLLHHQDNVVAPQIKAWRQLQRIEYAFTSHNFVPLSGQRPRISSEFCTNITGDLSQ